MQKEKFDGLLNIILLYSFVIIGFLVTILKAKVLTEEEIGVLAIIINISALINSFICTLCDQLIRSCGNEIGSSYCH